MLRSPCVVFDRTGKKATIQAQIRSALCVGRCIDDDQRRDRDDRRHLQDDGVGEEGAARSSATAPRGSPARRRRRARSPAPRR